MKRTIPTSAVDQLLDALERDGRIGDALPLLSGILRAGSPALSQRCMDVQKLLRDREEKEAR